MSDDSPPDTDGTPLIRTGIGHFLIPTIQPEGSDAYDLFVPALARDHQPEIIRVAAFFALWSFAATGCLLPWTGLSPLGLLQNAICLLAWSPLWFIGLILCVALPGALILPMLHSGILTKEKARWLSTALAILIFSVIALFLARYPLPLFQVVGWIWLGALGIEALLRIMRLFAEIRR